MFGAERTEKPAEGAEPGAEADRSMADISSCPAPSLPYRIPRVREQEEGGAEPRYSASATTAGRKHPVVQTTYERRISPDKPKIPRKLREIQEHLMFEKILKTGSKNTLMKSGEGAVEDAGQRLSAAEIKELGEQQAQRRGVEEDEEDYFDNDAEFINDEYLDDIDSPAPETEQTKPDQVN